MGIFSTTLLAYRSAIYPQGMTFEYGLGGRLPSTKSEDSIEIENILFQYKPYGSIWAWH